MFKKLFYGIGIILFLWTAYLIFDYLQFQKQREAYAQKEGAETTALLRDRVDTILSEITAEGNRLADLFGSNDYTEAEIERIIKESAESIAGIQGVTACYEPGAFSDEKRLFCPYYNKGTQDYLYVGKSYDYFDKNVSGTAWYTEVRDEGAKWVEPYFAKAAQDWYVDYGIPFYYTSGEKKGRVRGTITMSFVASGFKELVHKLALGKTGYGLITSKEGTFLAHPVNEYVGTTKLGEVQTETNPVLANAYAELLAGESGKVEFAEEESGEETLFFYDKIPTSGWGIGLFFYKEDFLDDSKVMNRKFIRIAISLSFLLVCIMGIIFGKDYLDEREIWILSLLASVLLIANIFLVGQLQHTDKKVHGDEKSPPITDLTALSQFITAQHLKADTLKTAKPTPIPTGMYVERMEFQDSYNLNVGGKIWQKYPLALAEEVSIGVQLPQMSPFSEAEYLEESYRKIIEPSAAGPGYLLVGWDFRVTLLLNLNYSDFPLDKRHINIRITPSDNNDNLILTPDLASYTYTNPSRKSGLNPDIRIPGSEILESYFNYSTETYDSDFGYGQKALFEEVPVLHYNVHTRRLLLNAFVTYLIPIFVTLIMVFILIYACHKTQERQGIIESMAAFFFVLIFSHIDMRKEIVTADLIYIEYFYFVAYFMLVTSTANLITYTKDKSKIFDFNDNQIFKASYFPAFFLIILVVTLVKFY